MNNLRAASRWAAAATVAAVVAACSDITPSGPNGPHFNAVELPPQIIKVCKQGPAGVYNFRAISGENFGTFLIGTPVTSPDGNGSMIDFQVAAGQCVDVYKNGLTLEAFTVSEEGPMPAGVELDFITYQQMAFLETPDGPLMTLTGTNTLHFEPFPKPWTITFYNKKNEQPGLEGCTPGFWKNSPGSWPATGYAVTDNFDAIFGVNAFTPDITLMQAINLKGGGVNALARHAVAGLLGAGHPDVDYTLSTAQIIAGVQAALAGGDIEGTKDLFDRYNNQGCPLPNDNSFGKKN